MISIFKWMVTVGVVFLVSGFVFADVLERPVVSSIRFYGAEQLKQEALLKNLTQKSGQPFMYSIDSLSREIVELYAAAGLYLARIDSAVIILSGDSLSADLEFKITEGKRCKVRTLRILGVDSLWLNPVIRLFDTREGSVFDGQYLKNDIQALLTSLENDGFPLAVVEIQSLGIDLSDEDPCFDIHLNVISGPRVHVAQFHVEGNTLTRSGVILREIRIPWGSVYRENAIQGIREHLQRLEYFDSVGEPGVLFLGDSALVTIRVKEGRPNSLDGVIGYTPSGDPERPGYFTGRLHFNFKNFLGTGRFLEAFWEKKDKVSQAMRFGYEEPWVLGYPVHAGWRFEQEIRDTTYVDRGWRVSLRVAPTPQLSLNMECGVREILPDSLGSVIHNLAQSRAWVGTLGFNYSTMDDVVNPSRGMRYRTSATFGRKRHLGPDFLQAQDPAKRFNTRLIVADAEFVFGLRGRQVFFAGLHGQEVRSGQTVTPLAEQIRFGGTTTLRGYAEDAFRGDLVSWLNLEYRYLLGRKSRVFLFFDAGMYQRREPEKGLIRSEKTGYGFGIRLSTRLGIMGVDYGLGQGDGLLQGKVHVGLINRF